MLKERPDAEKAMTPQYQIITRSESRYQLIKTKLLDTSRFPAGSTCYFVRVYKDTGCICRIRAGTGAVMFYEIINHYLEGITDEDIQEAIRDPANACPLDGYYTITPTIEAKLHNLRLREDHGYPLEQKEKHSA